MKYFQKIILSGLVLISLVLPHRSQGQTTPVYLQHTLNPYIYNPSLAGLSGYKKQWWGVEGSPSVASVQGEMPMGKRLSLGGSLFNVTEGPLNQFNLLGTAAYKLPIAQDQHLYFGMSFGILVNSILMDKVSDPNDPALTNGNNNSLTLDGNAAITYQRKEAQVAIIIPHLIRRSAFNSQFFASPSFEPWDYLIFTGQYKVDFLTNFSVIPKVLFHYQKALNNQIELAAQVTYLKKYWIGGNLRQNYGASLLAGAEITSKYAFQYHYTFSSPQAQLTNDTHELVLRLRFQ